MFARFFSSAGSAASTRVRLAILGVVALLVITTSAIVAASPPNPGPFTGCLSTKAVKGIVYNVAISPNAPQAPCLSGDSVITFSNAQGAKGDSGTNGVNGAPGKDGAPGVKGDAGAPGTNGTNGTNGTPGKDGTNGAPGGNGSSIRLSSQPFTPSECASGAGQAFEIVDGVGLIVAGTRTVICNGATGKDGAKGDRGPQGDPGQNGAGLSSLESLNGLHCDKLDATVVLHPGVLVVQNTPTGSGASVGSGNPVSLSCEYSAVLDLTFAHAVGDLFVFEGPLDANGFPSGTHQWATCTLPGRGGDGHCTLRLPAGTYSILPAALNATWSAGCIGNVVCQVTLADYTTTTLTAQ